MDRRAIYQAVVGSQQAHLLNYIASHPVENPAQIPGTPIELALANQTREQAKVIMAHETQELTLVCRRESQPVLRYRQGKDFAIREGGFGSYFPGKQKRDDHVCIFVG